LVGKPEAMSKRGGKILIQDRGILPILRDWVIGATGFLKERKFLSVLLAYSLITVIFTYPVVLNVATSPAGSPYMAWTMWWAKTSLIDLRANLANLTFLYYPQGAHHPVLWMDVYVMASPLPLVLLFGPVFAYNLHFLATYALTGFTTYLLCYYLTRQHWPSFVGGLIFALSPFRSGPATVGELNLMITYWLPLYVLFLLRLCRNPSNRNALLCGIFLALSILSNPLHVAHFVVPFTLLFVGYKFLTRPRRLIDFRLVRGLGLAVVVSAIFISPFYLPFLAARISGEELGYLERHGLLSLSGDLLAFLVPPSSQVLIQAVRPLATLVEGLVPRPGHYPVYIGIVASLLAGIAAWKMGKRLTFWIIATLVGAVLSLGPLLHIGGQLVEYPIADKTGLVVLPGALLTALPLYEWIRVPGRFHELTTFSLAILASYGVSILFPANRNRIVQYGLAAALAILIPVEYALYFPSPVVDKLVPEFYRTLANDSEEYGILDIGPQWNHWGMYYQMTHLHPIVRGDVARLPSEAKLYLDFMDQLVQPEPDLINRDNMLQILNQLKIRYVVLHSQYPDIVERLTPFLSQMMDSPVYEDEQITAFAVPTVDAAEVGEIPLFMLGEQWYLVESIDGVPSRWMLNDSKVYARVETERWYQLALVVHPFREPRHLQILVNEELLEEYHVGGLQSYVTSPFLLKGAEWTSIRFHVPEECEVPSEVMDEPGDDRCLSMLFQQIDVVPAESEM
jgi:hypothetical protein